MAKGNGKGLSTQADVYQLVGLRIRNVRLITGLDIRFDRAINEIRGDADQGKTTIPDCVQAAIDGLEPSMVRNGADKGEVELLLDRAIIKRITSADGSQRAVMVTADGKPIAKNKDAEAFLDAICNRSAFDPLYWVQLGKVKGKGQTEALRNQRNLLLTALNVSLTDDELVETMKETLEQEHIDAFVEVSFDEAVFEQHAFVVCETLRKKFSELFTVVNAELTKAEHVRDTTAKPARAVPHQSLEQLRSLEKDAIRAQAAAEQRMTGRSQLAQQAATLRATIAREAAELPPLDELGKTFEHYTEEAATAAREITRIETEITRLQEVLELLRKRQTEAKTKLVDCESLNQRIDQNDARREDLARLEAEMGQQGEHIDLEAFELAIQECQADVEARRLQDVYEGAVNTANAAETKVKTVEGLVSFFRDELPRQLIRKANLPIEGLGIKDDYVTVNDLPFHELGTSKQLRYGLVVATALNPRCKFFCLDRAESLGKADREALAEAAAELDLKLILTFVDPDAVPGPGVTVMRNGEAVQAA